MSIRSLEEALDSLKSLSNEQQELACEFIRFLNRQNQSAARAKVSPVKRPRGLREAAQTGLALRSGLWVHVGRLTENVTDWSGRALEFQRTTARTLKQIRRRKTNGV